MDNKQRTGWGVGGMGGGYFFKYRSKTTGNGDTTGSVAGMAENIFKAAAHTLSSGYSSLCEPAVFANVCI